MFNQNYYNSIKIFIASPGDVQRERSIADKVIADVDRISRSTFGLRAECLRWEDLPPMTPQAGEGEIQDVIIRELVNKCNVFVLILNKRYGTVTPNQTIANTEREAEAVLKLIERGKSIMLLTYFRELHPNSDVGDQENKVRELRRRLEQKGLFYQTYKNNDDFKQKLIHDLYFVLIRFQMAVTKQRSLRAFWDLGDIDDRGSPELAIIYPPLDRPNMKAQDPDRIWLERLVPNVVFEDFKAMNKVEKTLRIIGHHQIITHTTKSFPHTVYDVNRVWLCLPRNAPGIHQMSNYAHEACFQFMPRQAGNEGHIRWRPSVTSDYFAVRSPLAKYLHLQRTNIPGGEWSPAHGNVIAKDYAVIARFTDKRETNLKDYFLAGIRGLGTWGAGWYIDRRYKSFLKWENRNDVSIQLLLEVIYKNEHVHEVIDVSDQPASYFEHENDIETVKQRIAEG